jgi:hypothetical protein
MFFPAGFRFFVNFPKSMFKSRLYLIPGFSVFAALLLISCAVHPKGDYRSADNPKAPDYSLENYWAALPDKQDLADSLPTPQMRDVQANAAVDVFFIHPTTYTSKKGFDKWNGPVNDPKVNKRTDESTILYQASIFNGVGKVYAPRYRQAHIFSYFTKKDTASANQAFELAYSDVRRAFQYYLDHYNRGRPIVLATHSQGTTHGIRLIKDFFDDKPLQKQLVVAYLVGMPVMRDTFQQIPLCRIPAETACFCSWRTFKRGTLPKRFPKGPEIAVTNPLSWTMSNELIPKKENKGAVLSKFNRIFPQLANAQINEGVLWTDKPKFPWSFLILTRNYHIADFNLYYVNVRENAQLRVKTFLEEQ